MSTSFVTSSWVLEGSCLSGLARQLASEGKAVLDTGFDGSFVVGALTMAVLRECYGCRAGNPYQPHTTISSVGVQPCLPGGCDSSVLQEELNAKF